MKTVTDFLAYQNHPFHVHLLNRYREDYPNNRLSAEEALEDMLKFFWLSYRLQLDKKENPNNPELDFFCVMHKEMEDIDDMWHTFLLFTRAYQEFCLEYFGEYQHHSPNIVGGEPTGDDYELPLRRYLNYILAHLGETTLCRWFSSTLDALEEDETQAAG